MLQFEELRLELNDNKQKLSELREALGLDALKEEIAKLEEQTAAEEFWGDIENSQKVLQRISQLKNKVAAYTSLETAFDDTMTLIELADEEEDLSMFDECREGVTKFEDELEKQTLSTLLNGEYDAKNALLTFHAGAGGTEAQDWTQMLVRMYQHWGEKHNFKVSMLDFLDGDEAGLKSAVLLVEGENAYGYLKGEMGVHRLVRVSPFDSSGRRHTSFASLEVMPEIDDNIEVEINPDDLKVDTSLVRRGRPEGQQDLVRRAYNAYPDRYSRLLPDRAQPASEPRGRDENAQIEAPRDKRARASRQNRGYQGRPERDRLGQPDPLLCLYALHPRQGSPHRL